MGAPWRQWPPTGEEWKSWGKWWKKMMETAGTSHQHPIECRHFSILLLVPFLVQITFNEISFISAHQWSIFVKLIWIFGPSSFGIVWISPWNSHGNERQASANWCHSFGTFPPEKKKYSNNLTAFQNGWNTFVPRSGLIDTPKWFSLKVHQHCQIYSIF